MQKQYEYNEKTAENNQKRNKEMWDYTNYENQVKHAQNAGLNPALLYGMSGGGGATAAGAQGMGAGIASGYEKSINAKNNKFKGKNTDETYRLPNGAKTNLPIYYRNKIYSEEEREALFLSKVENGIMWICGEKCFIYDYDSYINLLEYHRNRASTVSRQSAKLGRSKIFKKARTPKEC